VKINDAPQDAHAVADSINKEIDLRYGLHKCQLATKTNLAEVKVEIIKWTIGSMMAVVALFAVMTAIWR
jgi:hypothetical protein